MKTAEASTLHARHLDGGHYVVSDQTASALCRVLGQPLPTIGHEKFVMLRVTCETGEQFACNAWLTRADTRHSVTVGNQRGWHWAVYAIRRDAGAYLPALGKTFALVPLASTQGGAA